MQFSECAPALDNEKKNWQSMGHFFFILFFGPIYFQKLLLVTYLITKDFDLTVATVEDLGVSRILECVNLDVQWQTLEIEQKKKVKILNYINVFQSC